LAKSELVWIVRGGSRFLPIKLIKSAMGFYPSKAVGLVGRGRLPGGGGCINGSRRAFHFLSKKGL
jgi:hypothetical protein